MRVFYELVSGGGKGLSVIRPNRFDLEEQIAQDTTKFYLAASPK